MPTALLIGFEYVVDRLPGAIIDLYHAYKWCTSFNCSIHVLTDIRHVKNIDNLRQAIDEKIAEEDLLTFYNNIKSKAITSNKLDMVRTIARFLSEDHIIKCDLPENLCKIKVPDDKIIIYYSGHGMEDSMVLPDKSLFPFIEFRDVILDVIGNYTEIFWILDCCNPNGLYLPFKLEGNLLRLSSSKVEYVHNPILLITSSESDEQSIATKHGSVFSRHLFRLLATLNDNTTQVYPSKNRNLRRLIRDLTSSIRKMHTGYSQTVSIYSSYIIVPVLWTWIGSRKGHDIVTDFALSTLIMRNNGAS